MKQQAKSNAISLEANLLKNHITIIEDQKQLNVQIAIIERPETTERPDHDHRRPETTERPDHDHRRPETTERPDRDHRRPETTERPDHPNIDDQNVVKMCRRLARPETTERPDHDHRRPETTERPDRDHKRPETTERPDHPEHRRPETTERLDHDHRRPETTERPDRDHKRPETTERPDHPEHRRPETTERPDHDHRRPETTERPDHDHRRPETTERPDHPEHRRPERCEGAMKQQAREQCNQLRGKFIEESCRCIEISMPHIERPTTCIDYDEDELISTTKPCTCTCSPDCKRRKIILDVLLKAFYKDVYNRSCCQEGCKNCPNTQFPEGDSSDKTDLYEVLVKLFKPQNGDLEAGSVEVKGGEIDDVKKSKFAKAFKDAITNLEDVFNT
ncbi:hypothetical protein PVAND_017038 [Polypedilum vanderplanki]|uniref:Uncharacterized protein n=1 Tax=Polypedilum vanderplanki TaxID=319348 RepID=A0A9J6BHV1_POLVA|nr:hypothetical protein PVAND_017038 [Polypedilum vanderplanki]